MTSSPQLSKANMSSNNYEIFIWPSYSQEGLSDSILTPLQLMSHKFTVSWPTKYHFFFIQPRAWSLLLNGQDGFVSLSLRPSGHVYGCLSCLSHFVVTQAHTNLQLEHRQQLRLFSTTKLTLNVLQAWPSLRECSHPNGQSDKRSN